jgi:hypothetical protein
MAPTPTRFAPTTRASASQMEDDMAAAELGQRNKNGPKCDDQENGRSMPMIATHLGRRTKRRTNNSSDKGSNDATIRKMGAPCPSMHLG